MFGLRDCLSSMLVEMFYEDRACKPLVLSCSRVNKCCSFSSIYGCVKVQGSNNILEEKQKHHVPHVIHIVFKKELQIET